MSGENVRAERPRSFPDFCVIARPRVCASLRAMTSSRDGEAVEDAVQEALLIARHRWDEVGAYRFPEAWLVRVSLRILVRWRDRDRSRFTALEHDPADDAAAQALDHLERVHDLAAVIATLPTRQRQVITLHYRLDLPVVEIATVLDMRPGTVTSLLARGRATIAARWSDGESR